MLLWTGWSCCTIYLLTVGCLLVHTSVSTHIMLFPAGQLIWSWSLFCIWSHWATLDIDYDWSENVIDFCFITPLPQFSVFFAHSHNFEDTRSVFTSHRKYKPLVFGLVFFWNDLSSCPRMKETQLDCFPSQIACSLCLQQSPNDWP